MSIVRENLMEDPGYRPYCGRDPYRLGMPRTEFDGEQFRCRCGWRSGFPAEFIAEYKTKHGLTENKSSRCATGGFTGKLRSV